MRINLSNLIIYSRLTHLVLSLVTRKPGFGFFDQVRPDRIADISNIETRELLISSHQDKNALTGLRECTADLYPCCSHMHDRVFFYYSHKALTIKASRFQDCLARLSKKQTY